MRISEIDKQRIHRKILIVIVAAIVIVMAICLYGIIQTKPADDERQDYTLTIRVIPNTVGSYSVILPLIVSLNASLTPITEDSLVLDAVGYNNGRMIETQYGDAFELNASDILTVNIHFKKTLDPSWRYDHFGLSMCDGGCGLDTRTYPYFANLNSSSVTSVDVYENLTFAKNTSRVSVDGFYLCNGTLQRGWHELQGLHRMSLS